MGQQQQGLVLGSTCGTSHSTSWEESSANSSLIKSAVHQPFWPKQYSQTVFQTTSRWLSGLSPNLASAGVTGHIN
jgi:hypothetical protein